MDPEVFVRFLATECRDSAVDQTVASLLKPAGRRPSEMLVSLSQWFNSLAEADRNMVVKAMQESAHATLFGVLCVIDGARTIEPAGAKSDFELTAIRAGVRSVLAPGGCELHDLLVREP